MDEIKENSHNSGRKFMLHLWNFFKDFLDTNLLKNNMTLAIK